MLKSIAIAALIAATGVIAGTGAAAAQDPTGAAYVETTFTQAEAEILNGARSIHQGRGILATSGTADHEFRLEAGKSYMVIGICDENCSDIDLAGVDPAGELVGSDVLEDDTPLVAFQATTTGNYTFRVLMAACTARCNYGVRVYPQ